MQSATLVFFETDWLTLRKSLGNRVFFLPTDSHTPPHTKHAAGERAVQSACIERQETVGAHETVELQSGGSVSKKCRVLVQWVALHRRRCFFAQCRVGLDWAHCRCFCPIRHLPPRALPPHLFGGKTACGRRVLHFSWELLSLRLKKKNSLFKFHCE